MSLAKELSYSGRDEYEGITSAQKKMNAIGKGGPELTVL
jgi:hypothetical protein